MGGKRIGVHQYCNITPVSALGTPNQVTQRLLGHSSSEESRSTGELGQELFPCPRVQQRQMGHLYWGQVQSSCSSDRSSRDKGGDGNSEEEGGERFPVSSRLWQMRAQSYCTMNSTMNAKGMT